MPIRGSNHSALIADEAPYFRSLADLDDWAATPTKKLEGVLPYVPRSEAEGVSGSATRGKLCAMTIRFFADSRIRMKRQADQLGRIV
ncbi:hypothetical protein L227DRAFT_313082 [Lentinus tigrinus ALCF2SS1-6]|uniref:Uncharacterized protein n=1 Tax=Lentinus tigrinus ALCF2SS1-6 TaxID=1328759 RepID=A0A5C2RTR0_9APHY|nr:hypothetical protein L227DRAFT_313082 [Lentinus tigrinus ALCF2SS1-6]